MVDKQREKDIRKARIKKGVTILKFILLLGIVIGLPLYIFLCHGDWIATMRDLDKVRELMAEYKTESVFIYLGAQILQIIISVIPGQALQIAGGFMFGFFLSLLLSLVGACIGTVITYYLGDILGRDFMHLFFDEKTLNRYIDHLNSKKAATIVFLIYLIPGIPKDVVSYAAGASEIKLKPFLLLSLVGRLPGMMGSLLIGKQIYHGSYTGAIVIAIIAAVAFVVGILTRKRLMKWFDKAYDKIYEVDKEEETEKEEEKTEE